MADETPSRCAASGCTRPPRERTSARGPRPRYCAQHAGESQRRAAAGWRERQETTLYEASAGPARREVAAARMVRQARRLLEQQGLLVGDYDLCLVALLAALGRRPHDRALVARRAKAADSALAAVVDAWSRCTFVDR